MKKPNELEREIRAELMAYFNDELKVAAWLKQPNEMLGGYSPKMLLKIGRGRTLLQFIRDSKEGNIA